MLVEGDAVGDLAFIREIDLLQSFQFESDLFQVDFRIFGDEGFRK